MHNYSYTHKPQHNIQGVHGMQDLKSHKSSRNNGQNRDHYVIFAVPSYSLVSPQTARVW